jgi:8-oxo-dGTP pyrophosphatase MutT (NUDIX family)
MRGWVSIVKVIIVKDFKFLVVVRGKDGLLDLPGGHLDKSEGVCQGLVREVSEETGLLVARPESVNRWRLPTCKGTLNGMTFCCDYKQGRAVLSHEHTDYFWQELDKSNQFSPLQWVKEFSEIYMLARFAPNFRNGATVEGLKCQDFFVKPGDLGPAYRISNVFKRHWVSAFVRTTLPESHHNFQKRLKTHPAIERRMY